MGRPDYGIRSNGDGGAVPGERVEGILVTAATGPGCYTDAPTTATLRVYRRDPATGRKTETARTVTLTIFDPDVDAPAGAVARAEWREGCWQIYWHGCGDALAGCSSSSSGA